MSKNILIKSLGTSHYTRNPLHEEISVCFHSKKFYGGGGWRVVYSNTWWPIVTIRPVCLIKLSRKQKMLWTLGFFLESFSQLISTTGSWDSLPMYMVTHGDHGTSVSDKIVQKTKNVVNFRFFLRIFFPAHFDHRKLRKSFMVGGGGGGGGILQL